MKERWTQQSYVSGSSCHSRPGRCGRVQPDSGPAPVGGQTAALPPLPHAAHWRHEAAWETGTKWILFKYWDSLGKCLYSCGVCLHFIFCWRVERYTGSQKVLYQTFRSSYIRSLILHNKNVRACSVLNIMGGNGWPCMVSGI